VLILSRRTGEAIDIIDSRNQEVLCTLTVLKVKPDNQVSLGFNAKPHISLVRDDAIRVLNKGESNGPRT
jgi:carbon storage regulator CsrA